MPDFLGKNQFLLEQAVTGGNGAIVEMNTSLVRKYIRRTKVEMAMMRAIREKSFEVYYQPIYSIRREPHRVTRGIGAVKG